MPRDDIRPNAAIRRVPRLLMRRVARFKRVNGVLIHILTPCQHEVVASDRDATEEVCQECAAGAA